MASDVFAVDGLQTFVFAKLKSILVIHGTVQCIDQLRHYRNKNKKFVWVLHIEMLYGNEQRSMTT